MASTRAIHRLLGRAHAQCQFGARDRPVPCRKPCQPRLSRLPRMKWMRGLMASRLSDKNAAKGKLTEICVQTGRSSPAASGKLLDLSFDTISAPAPWRDYSLSSPENHRPIKPGDLTSSIVADNISKAMWQTSRARFWLKAARHRSAPLMLLPAFCAAILHWQCLLPARHKW